MKHTVTPFVVLTSTTYKAFQTKADSTFPGVEKAGDSTFIGVEKAINQSAALQKEDNASWPKHQKAESRLKSFLKEQKRTRSVVDKYDAILLCI